MSERKTLAQLVAELEDPLPTEVDPESINEPRQASDDDEGSDEDGKRDHYELVGTSELRKASEPSLGPQYLGSHVSRKSLYEEQEVEDNPFSQRAGSDLSNEDPDVEEEYDDPDQVDLDFRNEEDEDIDSDEAFDEGEEETFRTKGFTFRDSGKSLSDTNTMMSKARASKRQESSPSLGSDDSFLDGDLDMPHGEDTSGNEDLSEDLPDSETDATSDSATEEDTLDEVALGAMTSSQQKHVVAKLSEAASDEVAKGITIKKQYTTFDTLVGSRVHLQKSLIAANSINAVPGIGDDRKRLAEAAAAAESAAVGVLNSLTSLLHSVRGANLGKESQPVLGKRPFSATVSMSSQDISEVISELHEGLKSQRRQVLAKWESKTRTTTLSAQNRLVQKDKEDSLVDVLDGHLLGTNQERLVQKTRIARSCAPVQSANHSVSNTELAAEDEQASAGLKPEIPIFDDADFYAILLRELIDHKKTYTKSAPGEASNAAVSSAIAPGNLLRNNKSRRINVDTKASKGRKMKYVVHEKLQNFVAPVDLGTWETRQAEELFASLLGRKIARLDEEVADEDMEMQGLRLFAGVS